MAEIVEEALVTVSNQAIHVFEMDTVGWDQQIKTVWLQGRVPSFDFRVTSIGIGQGTDELWMGMDEGHLMQFSVKLGQFGGRRFFAHPHCPVSFIRPTREGMLTVDNSGLAAVWPPSLAADVQPLLQFTTLAHPSVAQVFGNDIWVASNRLIKIVRVDGLAVVAEQKFSVADVCSSPVVAIEFAHGRVLMAHEDGRVLVWRIESKDRTPAPAPTLEAIYCTGVYRISSMAMVGERHLWVGLCTGRILVVDMAQTDTRSNWSVLAEWAAHSQPVIAIRPESRPAHGRVVSVGEDSSLAIWDGTLHDCFVYRTLREQEPTYSSYRQIEVVVCSWNVDSLRPPDGDEFWSEWTRCAGDGACPDVFVLGLQEIVDLESKTANAKSILGNSASRRPERGRIWTDRMEACLATNYPSAKYLLLISKTMVGLLLAVFFRADWAERLRFVAVDLVKTGLGGYHGNKGGIAARFFLDDSSFCVVNCHLAAGSDRAASRNADAIAILRSARFPPIANHAHSLMGGGRGSLVMDHEHCIVFGDLNYRIELGRDRIIELVAAERWDELRTGDQLWKQIQRNQAHLLAAFAEGPLTFSPTYKYDRGKARFDSSDKQRAPAWCDRILYRNQPDSRESLRSIGATYRSLPQMMASDHRPIAASIAIKVKQVDRIKRISLIKTGCW